MLQTRWLSVIGLLVVAASAATLGAAAATTAAGNQLWGRHGENWDPSGLLPDFSFAGYMQGNLDELPRPPVTRTVESFRQPGMTDAKMLKAALKWAHAQPVGDDWIVLQLPAGQLELAEPLVIRRSKLVLRGGGTTGPNATTLYVPNSLTTLYGPNKDYPTGGYPVSGGFITMQGDVQAGPALATVQAKAAKGSKVVVVDNGTAINVGEYYDLLWQDVNGRFNKLMYNNLLTPPTKYKGQIRTRFVVKVVAKAGNRITLERYLPYSIAAGTNVVSFHQFQGAVQDSGVEDLAIKFTWERYAGHHLEKGWNGVYLVQASNCWVRNIRSTNPDSTLLMNGCTGVTVSGVRIEVTRTRANNIPNKFHETADSDGHWGVQFGGSYDVLVQGVDVRARLIHDMGTDTSSKFGVFMDSVMTDGNLDLHRGLSGPCLYTNIDVGRGTNALQSGGPPGSGANAAAGTTWWNIKSDAPVAAPISNGCKTPCDFGPVINLVGVNLKPRAKMCATWHYERSLGGGPRNLYNAQLARRRAAAAPAPALVRR